MKNNAKNIVIKLMAVIMGMFVSVSVLGQDGNVREVRLRIDQVVTDNCCQEPDLDCEKMQRTKKNAFSNMAAVYYGLKHYFDYRDATEKFLFNVFYDLTWFDSEELITFWNLFQSLLDTNTGMISEEAMQQLIVANQFVFLTEDYIETVVERYNRSVMYWNERVYTIGDLPEGYNTDFIEYDTAAMNKAYEAYDYAIAHGFSDVKAMYDNAYELLATEVENIQTSVCAHVTLQFNQKMTMTREAFNGTLQIFNGHDSIPMQDIMVDFRIEDQQGNNCTNLFQINTLSLDQITGISGDGSLAAQTNGTALVQFIPTKNAAPTQPVVYSFGGSFSFIDPFTGEGLTYPLYPVEITVHPSCDLHIDVCMQRNILGDDALTPDVVEPSVPAEFGVIINNKGAGTAMNVLLETAEPQIIDNEHGLAINFGLYGASLNGSPRQLGLHDISFGNIESGQTAVGEWCFTGSLLGHFVSYDAHVIHNNSNNNPDLSLVSHYAIHELIHPIYAYGSLDDGINDFLVNDNPDAYDTPDSIYFSHGGKTSVSVVDEIEFDHLVSPSDTIVTLTVVPSRVGWNYGVTDDPGMNQYDIVSCIRNNDNQVIPLNNVWQTFVTIPDGGDPVYENRLHIVDTLAVQQTTSYTLVYTLKPNLLGVEEIIGIPTESFIEYPLTSFQVKFNAPIIDSTFTYEDMTLKCQNGPNLMNSTVAVTRVTDSLYNVNIEGLTNESGYYVLNVNANDVKDERGYNGYNGKQATWVQVLTSVTQAVTMQEGWNWWSTYIEQNGIQGLLMLENSLGGAGIRIQGKNGGVDYFEYQGNGGWYGNLDDITNEQMYKIRTSEACSAVMEGNMAIPSNHPITINEGWNWIGFPSVQDQSLENALGDFEPEAEDIIKGRSSSSTYASLGTYNGWYGTLNTLESGQGYMYKSNSGTPKTLTFQSGRVNAELRPNVTPENNMFVPDDANYADNMLVSAVIEVNSEELRSEDYELAAFVGNECRGSVKLMYVEPFDRYVAFLLAFGDKAESMYFVLTDGRDMSRSTERFVYASDATIGTLTEPVTLHFGTLGMEDNLQLPVHIYPNPSKDIFNVEGVGIKKVEVVDTYGQVIFSTEVKNNNLQINLRDRAVGAYLLRVVTDKGVTSKKLVLVR